MIIGLIGAGVLAAPCVYDATSNEPSPLAGLVALSVRTGSPGSSVYQFTKGALTAMVNGVALDLAPRRITVNNVQLGPTETDINSGAIEMLSDRGPLKRVAELKEIAALMSYLARGESASLTSISLTMDGGYAF